MAQFTIYSSSDASGPGQIKGQAGEVLRVLDACLVNGYSGKTAAGWTKPIANASNIGSYKQGAGAGYGLVINDNGPNVTSTFKEAWATGWKVVTGVGSPVGAGTGQFPTAAQLLTSGHVVIRKSTTADTTGRNWVVFADASTFYMFILTGDFVATNTYFDFGFGDFYSHWGSSDANRCWIVGRSTENANTQSATVGGIDRQIVPEVTSNNAGSYFADNFAGSSGSQIAYPFGDLSKQGQIYASSSGLPLLGAVPTPNPADNSYYISPLWMMDLTHQVRGRVRGLYHLTHPVASFSDGMTFSGSGDYAGKTFQIVWQGMNGGFYCVETSNTLDTN